MTRIVSPDSAGINARPVSWNSGYIGGNQETQRARRAKRCPAARGILLAATAMVASLLAGPAADAAQFTLRWTDNSSNESGFSIERSSNGGSFSEIATVGSNVVSYVDASLASSTAYSFRVRAYNASGYSSYSNVASGTTAPAASNLAPTISDIADVIVKIGSNTGPIAFTVADTETTASSLTVSASSSNTSVVPTSGLVVAGSGTNRSVTITPAAVTGSSTVTVTVSDGVLTATDSFLVTVVSASSSIIGAADGFKNTTISPAQTSAFTIEFDATPSSAPIDAVIGLSAGAVSTFSDMAAIVRFNPSGTIDARNGGSYAASSSVSYSAGLRYHFRMVVDVTTRTYSVYATAPGGSEVQVANGFAFRTEQASTTSIGNWCVQIGTSGASVALANLSVAPVAAANTAPTISNIANLTISEDGTTGSLAFTIGDAQTATSSLTVSGSSSNTTLVPQANIVFGGSGANRTLTVTPAANQSGTATITVTVSDGALSVTDTFVLTVSAVNDAPTISNMANIAIDQGTSTGAIAFTIGDIETAASSLTVSASSSNTVLVPTANIVFGGTGANRTVSVTPVSGQSGTATITVAVSDGFLTGSDSFVLTVNAVNTAPTISTIASRTISEDGSTGAIAFTIGDSQTAAGSLTVSGLSSNTTLVPQSGIVFSGSGANRTVTVTPAPDQNGSATISIVVGDGSLSKTATFVLTVSPLNDAPVISAIANRNINQNTSTGSILFAVGDVDVGPANLVLTAASNNTVLVPVASIVFGGSGADRSLSISPVSGKSGTATITVTVSDGYLTASTSFVLTVTANNQAPTISSVADRTIDEDTSTGPVAFTVGDGQTAATSLVVTASSSNTDLVPSSGLVLGGSGASRTVVVTPAANKNGSTMVTLSVSDGETSTTTSFVVTVGPVNDKPTISAIADRTLKSGTASTAIGFVVGDLESDAADLSVSAVSSNATIIPTSGIALGGSGTNRTLTLTPASGKAGSGTITVSVSDGSAAASTSFSVTVTLASEAPKITSQPESQTIARNASASLAVVATGTSLSYQWYVGKPGDVSQPMASATSASFTTPKLKNTTSFWVQVTGEGGSVNSAEAVITVSGSARYFFGSVGGAEGGSFGMMIEPDGMAQLLAVTLGGTGPIDAGDIAVDETGAFSADIEGVGTLTGLVTESAVQAAVAGTTLVFQGTEDGVNGTTSTLAGRYDAALVNSSDGEIVVLAGPSGRAFVLVHLGGSSSAGSASVSVDGSLALTLADGKALSLALQASAGRVTGSVVSSEGTHTVDGMRSDQVIEKRLINTSVRAQVRGGDEIMIAGFFIEGSGIKRVLIRGVGPTLASFGVPGALADPTITLFRQGDTASIGFNDNWGSAANAAEIKSTTAVVGAFSLPDASKDAALLVDLPAGAYTAHVSGVAGGTGTAIVEVYDVDDTLGGSVVTNLSNISMRGRAGMGNDLVVAGFVVTGNAPKRVLIRAVGPELTGYGVSGALGDPVLTVFEREDGQETRIATNDDWGVDAAVVSTVGDHVGAFSLTPGSKSSAMVLWLEPGVYTAQASSTSGASGVAIVEVYQAP